MKAKKKKMKIDDFSKDVIKRSDQILGGVGKDGAIDRDKVGKIPSRGRG